MAKWAQVEADVQRMKDERRMFNSRHPLIGKTLFAAAQELGLDGYDCRVDHVEHVGRNPADNRMMTFTSALLFCVRESQDPQDFCRERHAHLDANWPDKTLPVGVLEAQAADVHVTDSLFRCDTPEDVAVHRQKRELRP